MDFRAKLVSWEQIDKWCEAIKEKVSNSFQPDIIVGLSRGGLVPARMLSDMLWIKDLISIKTEHWGITATASGKAVLKDPGRLNIEGKKVLVVDDITDTGQSMKLAYDFILEQKPAEVRTVTMLHITRSTFIPDFYAEVVDEKNWAWFIFPWNVYEDLDNLISRILIGNLTFTQIENHLKDQFNLNIDSSQLAHILEEFRKSGKIKQEDHTFSKA
ncbi:MAG: phosphoribosyltransferase [Candidatus Thermoplasmatota archaeon]|jgi:hypoxanthine phosphoribosyltransferase|nr:phosphoribosyltransferase [Candidatus Thermoplasmatota archaeon]